MYNSTSLHALIPFAELEVGEYEEEKKETLDQLKEFQVFLEKSLSGDMSLVDEFGTAQLVCVHIYQL